MVRDTGMGIDPADAARIFDPFVRLDAARSRDEGGAGLGLALVRAIVDAHGGAVTVGIHPGAGSRFTVRCRSPRPPEKLLIPLSSSPHERLLRLLAAGQSAFHSQGD